jgi:hypothetical protein
MDYSKVCVTHYGDPGIHHNQMMEIYQSIMALASQEVDEFQLEQLASQMQHPATAGLRLFETPGDDQSPTLGKRHRFREDSGQLSLGPSLSSKRTVKFLKFRSCTNNFP